MKRQWNQICAASRRGRRELAAPQQSGYQKDNRRSNNSHLTVKKQHAKPV
jgi:hypothetical protein